MIKGRENFISIPLKLACLENLTANSFLSFLGGQVNSSVLV
jgi:hypothetical protein